MDTNGALSDRSAVMLGSPVSLAAPSAPVVTRVVDDRYEIERVLGRGGMGVVYLAHDLRLRRPVALKMLAPQYEDHPELAARFRSEAEVLASIRHGNVVQVFDFCEGEPPAFAMELVRGESLADILWDYQRQGARLPIIRVLSIIRQIAAALDAVHRSGILHRDVKPENVIIEARTGRPVLIDFGLFTRLSREARMSVGYGTPQYMAPEMCPGGPGLLVPSTSPDVYSLACTAFELLTGHTVFESTSVTALMARQRFDRAPAPSMLRPELAPFDDVFRRALDKNPAERFDSAAALSVALDRAGAAWTSPASTAPPPLVRRDDSDAIRVLVVDDDDCFRRIAGRCAQLAFYRRHVAVHTAEDGKRALEEAAASTPHIIVLDYSMPGLNGVETLARIREIPGCKAAHVLVISANSAAEQRAQFALLGVSDFLEKPVAMRLLVNAIADLEPVECALAATPASFNADR